METEYSERYVYSIHPEELTVETLQRAKVMPGKISDAYFFQCNKGFIKQTPFDLRKIMHGDEGLLIEIKSVGVVSEFIKGPERIFSLLSYFNTHRGMCKLNENNIDGNLIEELLSALRGIEVDQYLNGARVLGFKFKNTTFKPEV